MLERLVALGAVEHAWGRLAGDGSRLVAALEHTQQALRLAPRSPAALFNRALITADLGMCRVSAEAWQRYLEIDRSSPWAAEGRVRLALLPCKAGPAPTISTPLEHALEHLLPLWLHARSRDRSRADRLLGEIDQLGARLDATGDHLVSSLARELRHAGPAQRAALAAYAAGRAAFQGERYGLARRHLQAALPVLRRTGSALVPWCEIWLAGVDLYDGRLDEARRRLEWLGRPRASLRSPRTRGKALWSAGLAALRHGKLESAADLLRAAREAYAASGDTMATAGVRTLQAETFQHLGFVAESWQERVPALLALQAEPSSFALNNALLDGAELAEQEGEAAVADALLDEAALVARERGDLNSQVEALLARGQQLRKSGEPAAASAAFRRALAITEESPGMDPRIRERFAASAHVGLWADPASAEPPAGEVAAARQFFHRYGPPVREIEALRVEAWRLRRRGDAAAAERTLGEAVAVLRRLQADLTEERFQVDFLDSVQDVFNERIELALAAGRPLAALQILEEAHRLVAPKRSGAPQLSPNWFSRLDLAAPGTALPGGHDGIVLVFGWVGDSLAWWTVEGESVRFGTLPAAPIRAAAKAFLAAADEERATASALAPLSPLLLGEPLRGLASGRPLTIVPDGLLQRLPFAALAKSAGGIRLIEQCALSLRPSLAEAVLPHRATSPFGRRRNDWRVLAVGDPAFDPVRFRALNRLPGAAREARGIADLYGRNALLMTEGAARVADVIREGRSREVLHLATHALAGPTWLDDTFVLAAGADGRNLATSRDLVPDVSSLQLVVLSACATLGGRPSRAGGLLGLARAFVGRGVPATVGTLWPVKDGLLGELMVDFHHGLRQGLAASEALRRAQLAYLRNHPSQRFLDWAAVELVGDLPMATTH